MRLLQSIALCLLASAALGCEVPVSGNEETPAPATWIGGTLRLEDGSALPGGPAVLFRFACEDPPPPLGSGLPRDFVILTEDSFEEGAALFTFPLVPASSCHLLSGFVDRDRDFHYAYSVSSQASAGDLAVTTVEVQTGAQSEGGDWVEPVADVLLRAASEVPLDPPAFVTVDIVTGELGSPSLLLDASAQPLATSLFVLRSRAVESDLIDVQAPFFTVVLASSGDGVADAGKQQAPPEILWPKVVIQRLDPSDPEALRLSEPPLQLVAQPLLSDPLAPGDPDTDLLSRAAALGVPFDGLSVLPVTSLAVSVPGLVVTSQQPLELRPIGEVAAAGSEVTGSYQVLVMNSSGQRWSLPNELSAYGEDDQGLSFRVESVDPETP